MKKKIILLVFLTTGIFIVFSFSIVGLLKSGESELLQKQRGGLIKNQNKSISKTNSKDNVPLNLKEVLNHPDKYDGKRITLNCYYYEAHEKVVLVSKVIRHEGAWRSLMGGEVWVSWGIDPPEDLFKKLNQLPGIGGRPDLYGRVQVEGIFQKTKGAGHLGEYKYAFEIYKFRVYDESLGRFIPEM